MKVEYLDHMGSDLSIVNAARVSMDKSHAEFDADSDTRLIAYLAREKHWTPFAHAQISLRITAPIFVARQLAKSQIGLVWSEVSRRYVDSEPEFYQPDEYPHSVNKDSYETHYFVRCRRSIQHNGLDGSAR